MTGGGTRRLVAKRTVVETPAPFLQFEKLSISPAVPPATTSSGYTPEQIAAMKKTCELLEAVRSQCQLLEPDLRDQAMAGIPEKIAFLKLKIDAASHQQPGFSFGRGPRGSSARRRRPSRAAVVTPTDGKAPAPFSAESSGAADGGDCKQS